jgi:hypothetical protein
MSPKIDSVFAEFVTVRQYADAHGKTVQWVYGLIDQGLPVLKTGKGGRGFMIHVPSANKWLLSRLKSRRKPARRTSAKPVARPHLTRREAVAE